MGIRKSAGPHAVGQNVGGKAANWIGAALSKVCHMHQGREMCVRVGLHGTESRVGCGGSWEPE